MTSFSLNSKYFDNVLVYANTNPLYKENEFTIEINSIPIVIPAVVASSLSQKITQIFRTDLTFNSFKINIDSKRNPQSTIEKIKNVIVSRNQVTLDDDEEMKFFADFGLKIGNDDFINPLREKFNEEIKSLSIDNVMNIIEIKQKFDIPIEQEIPFVAENFEDLLQKQDFFDFAKESNNVYIIERVISNDKLKLCSEDSLLTFIISIAKESGNKKPFYKLFNYVFLEYCSDKKCDEFLEFVKESIQDQIVHPLISCIGRKIHPQINEETLQKKI